MYGGCVSFIIKATLGQGPVGTATAFTTLVDYFIAAYSIAGSFVGPLLNTNDLKLYDEK